MAAMHEHTLLISGGLGYEGLSRSTLLLPVGPGRTGSTPPPSCTSLFETRRTSSRGGFSRFGPSPLFCDSPKLARRRARSHAIFWV